MSDTYRNRLILALCDFRRCADKDMVDVATSIADLVIEIACWPTQEEDKVND